jgi:hypothetical protein
MKPLVRWSVPIYRSLLLLYPRELRSRFAGDMVEVFEDLLSEAVLARGVEGLAAVWCTALWECLSVGARSRLKSSAVITGGVSFAVSFAIAWAFFRAVR